jgi:hypothetical protein
VAQASQATPSQAPKITLTPELATAIRDLAQQVQPASTAQASALEQLKGLVAQASSSDLEPAKAAAIAIEIKNSFYIHTQRKLFVTIKSLSIYFIIDIIIFMWKNYLRYNIAVIIKNKIKGVAKAPRTQYKGISRDNNNIPTNELNCCWE